MNLEKILIRIWLIIILVLLFILLFIFTKGFYEIYKYKNTKDYLLTREDIINNCLDKDIEETSYCLRKNIRRIYEYKKTKDNINLTFEELKHNGGDCNNWAELYEELGEELGFPTYSITLLNGEIGHRITILYHKTESDKTRYCVLDLLNVHCN